MHRLNLYGYHVRYGYSEYRKKNYDIRESVCFSTLFNSDCRSKYYQLYIIKGDNDLKRYYSNYCFFSKQEIKNHLKQIPRFCEMRFRVTDAEYKGEPAFGISFFINSENRLIHKYVLTWIRSLFEWPFYLYLLHARKMKQLPEFRFESVINLFNIVSTAYRYSYDTKIHTFGTKLGLLRKSSIIDNVLNKGIDRVNDIFPYCSIKDLPDCRLVDNFEDITDELFENNLPKYMETYNIIKSYESDHNRK
jgi:hypothetical protein